MDGSRGHRPELGEVLGGGHRCLIHSIGGPKVNDRLTEIHDRITAAVEALVSGDDWQQMLAVAARFHSYSTQNVWLILSACPEASQVAGYKAWKKLGRQVCAGERGIPILAPMTRRTSNDTDSAQTTESTPVPDQPTTPDSPATGHVTTERTIRGFRVVYVFDVTQTDGQELPDVRPVLLTDHVTPQMWDQLARLVTADGFRIERGWCQGANGYTDHAKRVVRVLDSLPEAAALKTLAHELAHCRLHGDDTRLEVDRARFEVEAESVAYIVMNHLGIDAADYSFPYLARWSCGDVDRIRATATTATTCARTIVAELEASADGTRTVQVAA
jgi:hypothetical protein